MQRIFLCRPRFLKNIGLGRKYWPDTVCRHAPAARSNDGERFRALAGAVTGNKKKAVSPNTYEAFFSRSGAEYPDDIAGSSGLADSAEGPA
jgi:hypothetical protein